MSLNNIKIVFLILSFCFINNTEEIKIKNYEEIIIPKGEAFTLVYEKPSYSDSGNYFYFKFNVSDNYQLIIKPEDETETKITVSSNSYWYNYYASSTTKKKYSFQIINSQISDVIMTFIDSSQEIDLNLEKFIDLNFDTKSIYDREPKPLIFNIDVTQNTTLYFKANKGSFINSDSLLYYCIKDEINECNYKILKSLNFEKGKKYKIKLNGYKYEEDTLYYKFLFFTLVKEVDSGIISYSYNMGRRDRYFMIKCEKYKTFYLYGSNFKYNVISKSEKELLPDNLDSYSFYTNYDQIKKVTGNKDYFIFTPINSNSIFFYMFEEYNECDSYSDKRFEIERGKYGLVKISNNNQYYIESSNKNMDLINNSLDQKDLKNNIYGKSSKEDFIYINSMENESEIKYYTNGAKLGSGDSELIYFKLISNDVLNSYLAKYESDSIFKRIIVFDNRHDFRTQYYSDIKEEYYLYIKKYYGFSNVYKYNRKLNQLTDYNQFNQLTQFYENSFEYSLINNELLIISGYQLFTLTMNYNSLFDFYIQKVNDDEEIKTNQVLYPTNNLIKILNKDKEYILKFTVDHLILLDKKFTNASVTFTDSKGNKFFLNKEKRIIDDLTGENVKVISTERALIYFYKRIPNYSEKGTIIFDKSQKKKIMKLTIKNTKKTNLDIMLVRDFCFEGYYPMLQADSWEKISSNNDTVTLYIENFYDKLAYEEDLNDEMRYIIYIFDTLDKNKIPSFNSNDYTFSDISYIDNLYTPGNKYNFEVIQPNSNGSIVLNFVSEVSYNFFLCKSEKIKFKVENSKGYFDKIGYPYEKNITENEQIGISYMYYSSREILLHSFESDNEFLFFYNEDFSFGDSNENEFKINSIKEIEKNIIRLIFETPYRSSSRKHIIIAKKSDSNNVTAFSDLCYVAKLMINNDDSIIVKTIYEDSFSIITKIDISKLKPTENDRFILSIIDEMIFYNQVIKYSNPTEFKIERDEYIEIKPDEIISFSNNKKFFKFEFMKESDEEQVLYFLIDSSEYFDIILYGTESDIIQRVEYEGHEIPPSFILRNEGTYYIEFFGRISSYLTANIFSIFISGSVIDRIDLSEKMYYKRLKLVSNINLNPSMIKVNNITEDRYAFFTYTILKYFLSFDELKNPFKICNDNTGECSSEIVAFKFLKNNNYTIYLYFIYNDLNKYYSFPCYLFFPVFEDIIIDKPEGLYSFKEPKIFIFNFTEIEESAKIYVTFINQDKAYDFFIKDNFSFEVLNNNKLVEIYGRFKDYIGYENYYKYIVIVITPKIGENPTQLIISNNILYISKSGDYLIPAGKRSIIYLDIDHNGNNRYNPVESEEEEEEEEKPKDYYINPLDFYNRIATLSSPEKIMLLFDGVEVQEKKDFIIQNFFGYPIYVDKLERDITIRVKKYEPRYVFFGIVDYELFNLYIQKIQSLTELSMVFDMNQLQFRLYSDFIPLSEFFSLYFFNMKDNINLYIKQYYGFSELNENSIDSIDLNDLSNLTRPIKNSEKLQSSFNKIINFKNDRFLTGYLGSNSYFDIYFEIDDNSTSIDLSPIMKTTFRSTGKYLKKNIEYNLNFTARHLAKLEYGENVQVSIYDGNEFREILTKDKPIAEIKGDNLKIKSNENALVYFYGPNLASQIEIENKTGYNVEIEVDGYTLYSLDFCFGGYSPIEIFTYSYNFFEHSGTIYLENVYDKLKVKLVEGEKLYFNYISKGETVINYIPNLNHKNNDYTFNYVPKKSEKKTLIINNLIKEKIRYQVNFCRAPHKIQMYYKDANSKKEIILEFNGSKTVIDYNITNRAHKLRFNSEEDFVFSYSFIDIADSLINDYKKWNKERKVLTDLTIVNVTKKYQNDSKSDIFTIIFKPNYIKSSTRYIIVIGSNTNQNSLDNLNNPCYVTKLVNEKPKGIKIVNVIDVGENDEIEEDIDIYDILGKTDKYIINIISQELRFEKKLNFYNAMIFTHRKSDKIDGKDNKGLSSTFIVLISLGGILILLIVLFILFKFWRKNNRNDLKKQARDIPNEKLLQEL